MKKLSSRFSIAVHILTLAAISDKICTSEYIASSVNTNPVLIRRIIGYLKRAGIVSVQAGSGGMTILRDLSEITLLDVYNAVQLTENAELFNFHRGNVNCKVGANIETIAGAAFRRAQDAMEGELSKVTIKDIADEIEKNQ